MFFATQAKTYTEVHTQHSNTHKFSRTNIKTRNLAYSVSFVLCSTHSQESLFTNACN